MQRAWTRGADYHRSTRNQLSSWRADGARLLPLVLGVLGACATQDSSPIYTGDPGGGGDPGGDPGGGGGGGGGYNGYCTTDSDCNYDGGSDYVCARDKGMPAAPSEIRTVHVNWTVSGQPASATSCTNAPDLQLFFGETGGGDWEWGFAPVPCAGGRVRRNRQDADPLRDEIDLLHER